VIDEIAEHLPARVLVLGATDTGKSTFIRRLLHRLVERGVACTLVDADPGQKHIGPPACITSANYRYLYELRMERLSGMYFVGSTSPRGHMLPVVVGTSKLASAASGRVTVVNTSGYVSNAGSYLKCAKIEVLEPELLVALERRGELEHLVRAYSHLNWLRLPVPEAVREKSPEERRAARRERFRRYFESAVVVEAELSGMRLQRGSELAENMLVGVADERGRTLGLGIVLELDEKRIRLLTPVREEMHVLQPGSMMVTREGEELGRVRGGRHKGRVRREGCSGSHHPCAPSSGSGAACGSR